MFAMLDGATRWLPQSGPLNPAAYAGLAVACVMAAAETAAPGAPRQGWSERISAPAA